MNLAEIEAFLAVVQNSSFTGAAKALFLRQSALSSRIQSLEESVGAALFTRGKGLRNTHLTPQGQAFLPIAEKWMSLLKETKLAISGKQYPSLALSAIHSISTFVLPEVFIKFTEQIPEVRVQLMTNRPDMSYRLVEHSTVEAAFVSMPQYSKRVDTIPLFGEEMTLACSIDSVWQDPVHPTDLDVSCEIFLDGDKFLTEWHEYWFDSTKIPKLHTDNILHLEFLLKQGNTWCVVPMSVTKALQANGKIRLCSLTNAPQRRTIYLLIRKNESPTPELNVFLAIMKDVMAQHNVDWLLD